MKNLVIVESPAKAKTISNYLGEEYTVTSSYGHIRDLPKKDMGVAIDENFQPTYQIPEGKEKRVKELQKMAKDADTVWLATDEDREGEAIAWHLMKALNLKQDKTKRIAFHEITEEAVKAAMDNPRPIDENLVDAQQARRVLDRLVGYELSPLLWRKIKQGLSAGRVQSVAVRLIVEREREIEDFTPESQFRIEATFTTDADEEFTAELPHKLDSLEQARNLLEDAKSAEFTVADVKTKPHKKSPPPPFTTSSLQQAAAQKLSFSVKQTMALAQSLYEAGKITYMRTDSVSLAKNAQKQAAAIINDQYGQDYVHTRQYQTKSKGAQEAHEAIRPTNLGQETAGSKRNEKRLYDLIRRRAMASQMSPARLQRTLAHINISTREETLTAKGEIVEFDGYMKVYTSQKQEDKALPELQAEQQLALAQLLATEGFTRSPPRYTEASLVKELEERGIGRPSTYAPTISTIQDRNYVEKRTLEGEEKTVHILRLENKDLEEKTEQTTYGSEKNKLFPTQMGEVVSDFVTKQFDQVIDYDFTAKVENEFDRIAQGEESWNEMIADFYQPFHEKVETAGEISRKEATQAHELGMDPDSGRPVYARMGRYGPMVQIGDAEDEEKPQFASLPKGRKISQVALEEALKMFELPLKVGETEDGQDIEANFGKYGPYVRAGDTFASIKPKTPFEIEAEEAKELIKEQREKAKKREVKTFENGAIKVLRGRYGPYVTDGDTNAKIPKDVTPSKITKKQASELIKKKKNK